MEQRCNADTTTDLRADLASRVLAAVADVRDPEIPILSIVDLGMVNSITCDDDGGVEISLTPTFIGCPAVEIIRQNVERAVLAMEGVTHVETKFVYSPPWTSERITEAGRKALREFGIAPPACHVFAVKSLTADCPYCGSSNTRLENMFGPTACRSVFTCNDCRQPFEAMKPV